MSTQLWTPGEAAHAFAQEHPDEVVITCAREKGTEDALTRAHLDSWSSRLAHLLIERGVGQGDYVAIVLPNSVEHIVATIAIYKAGGTPMPLSASLPPSELDALFELASPRFIFGDISGRESLGLSDMSDLSSYPEVLPPVVVPKPSKVVASGGSTGKPKLIVTPSGFAIGRGEHPVAHFVQMEPADLVYSPGPFYHNAPFFFTQIALFHGCRILINERFRAPRSLELIEEHGVSYLNVVPTMMQRMAKDAGFDTTDLSSVRRVLHMAAPCPAWAKQAFIDRFGGEAILELWSSTESTGFTLISGEEWLSHSGSVGKGVLTEFKILDENRRELAVGEIGEIYTRFADSEPDYQYLGAAPLEATSDGFVSVGDLGYLDEEGYLYLADRRTDMIISGGANIYPAEVEAVLSEHPLVQDVAVIGLVDDDLGRRVWAMVEPVEVSSPPAEAELEALCLQRLARYKVPRGIEIVDKLPRNEAGKIRRLALREARENLTCI